MRHHHQGPSRPARGSVGAAAGPAHIGPSQVGVALVRSALVGLILVGLTIGLAGPASAHVHVDGTDATQGGEGVLTFRVPTESDTASTTGVTVTFPRDHPIAEASTQPIPGWTAVVKEGRLTTPIQTDDGPVSTYVESVTWTADSADAGIKPSEFQQFAVSAGPLPDVASLVLPTLQTYSDGSTVNWNEQAATGAAEPEHPAPVLELAPGDDQGSGSTPPSDAPSTGEGAGGDAAPTATGDDTGHDTGNDTGSDAPGWPGWVGLVAGVLALGVAGLALARTGRGRSVT